MKLNQHESRVTALKWDNDSKRLFSGDDIGNVYEKTISIGLFSSKVQSGLKVLQEVDKAGIIQLNLFEEYLLISSTSRSTVLNINPNEKTIKTIGKKKRDGVYGSCFVPLKIGKSSKVRTLSARPKRRIWISELNKPDVKGTMKFNKIPDVDLDFGRIDALGEKYLVSYDTNQFVIIDLKKVTVASVETDIAPIIDLDIVHRDGMWVSIFIHSRNSDISILTIPGDNFKQKIPEPAPVPVPKQESLPKEQVVEEKTTPEVEQQQEKPDSKTLDSIQKAKDKVDQLKKFLPTFNKKTNQTKMVVDTDTVDTSASLPSPTMSTTSTNASTDDGSKTHASLPNSFKASMFTADDFEDAEEIVHQPDPIKKKRKSKLDDGSWDSIKQKKRTKKRRPGKKRRRHRRTTSDVPSENKSQPDSSVALSEVVSEFNPSTNSDPLSDSKSLQTSSAGEQFEDSEPSLKDVAETNPSSFFNIGQPIEASPLVVDNEVVEEKVVDKPKPEVVVVPAKKKEEVDPAFISLDKERLTIVDKWKEFMIDENPDELFALLEKWMFQLVSLIDNQIFQKGFDKLLPDSQEDYASLITFWFKYFIISPLSYPYNHSQPKLYPEKLHQNELFSMCAPYLDLEELVLFANEKENKYVVAMLLTLCESQNFALYESVYSLEKNELFTRLSKELSQHPSLTLWMFPHLIEKDIELAHTFLIQVYPIIHEKNVENHILSEQSIDNFGKKLCESFYLTYLIRLFKTNLECSMNLSFMNKFGAKLVDNIATFDPASAKIKGLPSYNLSYLESVYRELIHLAAQDDIQLNLSLIEKKCIDQKYDIGLLELYKRVGKIEDIFKLLLNRKNWKGLCAFMESKRHIRSSWVELFKQVQKSKVYTTDEIVQLMLNLLNANETLNIIETLDDDIVNSLSTNTFKMICDLATYESKQYSMKNKMMKVLHGHLLKHEVSALTPEVESFIPSENDSSKKLDHLLHTLRIIKKDADDDYQLNFNPLENPYHRYNESAACHWGINIDPSKSLCIICQSPLNNEIGSDISLMQNGIGYHTKCMKGTQYISKFEGIVEE